MTAGRGGTDEEDQVAGSDRDREPQPGRRGDAPGRPKRAGRPSQRAGRPEQRSDQVQPRRTERQGQPRRLGQADRSGQDDRTDQSERARPRRVEPPLPDDATGTTLDRSVRAELASLATVNAETVARHLEMTARLLDEDPDAAYAHAVAARERAGRVGAVREAAGLAAYRAGRFQEALSELRAARRISGDQAMLPVMADCERGLGRPEKALEAAASPAAARLDPAGRVELSIVVSGARRDLGQPEAAALLLKGPELRPERRRPWSARLFYAYADALLDAGRTEEARAWFGHAADADAAEETDAAERLDELDGIVLHDDE